MCLTGLFICTICRMCRLLAIGGGDRVLKNHEQCLSFCCYESGFRIHNSTLYICYIDTQCLNQMANSEVAGMQFRSIC
jgi:hypothetical protein